MFLVLLFHSLFAGIATAAGLISIMPNDNEKPRLWGILAAGCFVAFSLLLKGLI